MKNVPGDLGLSLTIVGILVICMLFAHGGDDIKTTNVSRSTVFVGRSAEGAALAQAAFDHQSIKIAVLGYITDELITVDLDFANNTMRVDQYGHWTTYPAPTCVKAYGDHFDLSY